jgi:hypothetical protein
MKLVTELIVVWPTRHYTDNDAYAISIIYDVYFLYTFISSTNYILEA